MSAAFMVFFSAFAVLFSSASSAAPVIIVGQVVDGVGAPVSNARVTLIDTTSEPPFNDVPQNLLDLTPRRTNSGGYFEFHMDLSINDYLLDFALVGVRLDGQPSVTVSVPMNIHPATGQQIAEIIFGAIVPPDLPSAFLEILSLATGVPVPQLPPLTDAFASQFGGVVIHIPEPPLTVLLCVTVCALLRFSRVRRPAGC